MITRRRFIKLTSTAAAGAVLVGWAPKRAGRYPYWGRVVVVRNRAATDGLEIDPEVVRAMLDRAIYLLTDGGGWRSLFPSYRRGETFAVKVNAINSRMTSHREVVDAVVAGLVGMGVPEDDIVVWDRSSEELSEAGYELNDGPSGLRVMGTDRVGYDRSLRVDLKGGTVRISRILTGSTYLINVPILKDHSGAGITFSLKNHLGSVDAPGVLHDRGLQECIAILNATPVIRAKRRLVVGDALFGVYRGGPGGSPQFAYNGLIVGTDPVAVDHQARLVIDEERARHGLGPTRPSHIEKAAQLGLGAPADEVRVEEVRMDVGEGSAEGTPEGYVLHQNFPNPFNSWTKVSYELPEAGYVQLAVYSSTGRPVRTLVDGFRWAGSYWVAWDGRDGSGRDLAGGVYICRLIVDGKVVRTIRMALVR